MHLKRKYEAKRELTAHTRSGLSFFLPSATSSFHRTPSQFCLAPPRCAKPVGGCKGFAAGAAAGAGAAGVAGC